MNEVKNKITKSKLIKWKELEWLQPEDFKDAEPSVIEKLKNSLKKNGFSAPFHVWENGKKLYILDGHHREKALRELEAEGTKIPVQLPANFVDCKNKKGAKKLVLIYNSHYATINQGTLHDWTFDFNMDELDMEINIPGIDIDIPDFEGSDIDSQGNLDEIETEKCPKCGKRI